MAGLALRSSFVLAPLLVAAIAACSEEKPPTCTPDESDDACFYDDDDLRACLTGTGIYGATTEVAVCTTSYCGGRGPSPRSCSDAVKVSARVAGGPWLEAAARHGLYTLPLEPGTYEVCPDAAGACTSSQCKCVSVTIVAGARVRVDRSDEFGAFGRVRTAKVAP